MASIPTEMTITVHLDTREHEALRKWMEAATEVLADLLPEVHMPGKRKHLERVIERMDQHAAIFGAASSGVVK